MTRKDWEEELLETTKKSWGFIATESKQALMLADFERRKSLINKLLQDQLTEVEKVVEGMKITQEIDKTDQGFNIALTDTLSQLKAMKSELSS